VQFKKNISKIFHLFIFDRLREKKNIEKLYDRLTRIVDSIKKHDLYEKLEKELKRIIEPPKEKGTHVK